jgi:regulator of protease activity HflC (stomatin/prohibitin superfamily)
MTAAALNHTQERKANTSGGGLMLLLTLVVMGLMVWSFIEIIRYEQGFHVIALIVLSLILTLQLVGFYSLQPNEAAAITLFGNYKGTDRTPGLRWVLPWYTKKKISLRVRNVIGQKLKVNDKRGNPIEIAAVVGAGFVRRR